MQSSPAVADIQDSRYSWLRLLVTLGLATVGNVGMWSYITVLPDVQADLGLDRGTASIPFTVTMLGFALGNMALGRVVDRHGVTRLLMAAGLVLGASYGLASLAESVVVLSAMQFVIGFATAASFGPLMADISHWFQRRRGIAVAIAASGNYLSGAIWPILLSGLMEESGWRAVYGVLALITAGAILPLALLLRRQVPAEAAARAEAASAAARRASGLSPRMLTGLLFVAGIGCCVAMSMPQVHIVAYCVDLGYGPAVGAEMLSLMLMGGVASRITFGLISDRLGGVRALLIGSTLQMLALFLYLPFDGLVSLYLVSFVFGLSQGGIVPAYAIIVREYLPPREAGQRMGFVIMGTLLGMALGGWMSGWIYDLTGSYHLAFLNGIAWNALNIVIMLAVWTRGRGARGLAAATPAT